MGRQSEISSSLGLEPGVVRLAEYDPEWATLFEAESRRILTAVSPLPLVLHHIGSTAVPGLPAKPVLDMLAGYEDPGLRADCIAAVSEAGYVYRGEQDIPGRDFFRRGDPRAYHLHMTRVGSDFWRDHLGFRDLLRSDPATRDGYAALKRQLAVQYPLDRAAYIEGKGPFIRSVLQLP